MENETINVSLFKSSRNPFLAMLDEAAVHYRVNSISPGTVIASGETVEILKALGIASAIPSLAGVLIAWIKSRASRKVILQTKDRSVVQLEVEGYSAEDVEKLLIKSTNISVIDVKTTEEKD